MQRIKSSRKIQLGIIAVIALLVGMNVYQYSNQPKLSGENLGVSGTLTVFVNGHQEFRADTIVTQAYEYIICKMFNATNLGATNGCGLGGAPNPCLGTPLIGTSGTTCNIAALGFLLSTSGSSPSVNDQVCPSVTSETSMAPVVVTTLSHTSYTSSITLSHTYTSDTSITISKICLTWVAATGGSYYNPGAYNGIYAESLFPQAQTLSSGQQLTVQWTFTF